MAIISLTGKINSGKDSVAKIIQELCPDQKWENRKFAAKLKLVASILSGIPVERFEDQEFKKTNMDSCWDQTHFKFKGIENNNLLYTAPMEFESIPMTPRDFIQRLGTEAIRDHLHVNTWVNALLADYKPNRVKVIDHLDAEEYVSELPNWIVTDTRFPNELKAMKDNGAITIKIVRPGNSNSHGTGHSSETALDHVTDWDYIIENDSTLEVLRDKVRNILEYEQFI